MELKEQVYVILLNQSSHVIGIAKISEGGLTSTIIDIRLILCIALYSLAVGIVLCHNHPSGTLKPSTCDEQLTEKLKQGASLLDIRVLDHVVLTGNDLKS